MTALHRRTHLTYDTAGKDQRRKKQTSFSINAAGGACAQNTRKHDYERSQQELWQPLRTGNHLHAHQKWNRFCKS